MLYHIPYLRTLQQERYETLVKSKESSTLFAWLRSAYNRNGRVNTLNRIAFLVTLQDFLELKSITEVQPKLEVIIGDGGTGEKIKLRYAHTLMNQFVDCETRRGIASNIIQMHFGNLYHVIKRLKLGTLESRDDNVKDYVTLPKRTIIEQDMEVSRELVALILSHTMHKTKGRLRREVWGRGLTSPSTLLTRRVLLLLTQSPSCLTLVLEGYRPTAHSPFYTFFRFNRFLLAMFCNAVFTSVRFDSTILRIHNNPQRNCL